MHTTRLNIVLSTTIIIYIHGDSVGWTICLNKLLLGAKTVLQNIQGYTYCRLLQAQPERDKYCSVLSMAIINA